MLAMYVTNVIKHVLTSIFQYNLQFEQSWVFKFEV